ncbi:MAG: nucleotidyl transferase AbiEii/AbiGii toxin family protein [Chitinophagaceae bacterium]
MSVTIFLNIPAEERANIFNQISAGTRMPPFAVEKDWWVVQILSIVFEMEVAKHLVFKGGTSLSKAWKLIERFSEDIDLAIDRALFGFGANDLKRKDIDKLRKSAGTYVDEEFLPEFSKRIKEKGFKQVNIELEAGERSDRDRKIIITYPNVIASPGYLQPKVQIEFSCRSLMEPATIQSFSSLVDEFYPEAEFSSSPISVKTVNAERTFLEKIFLLHEEFQRPLQKVRSGERLSRHLYDVVKLAKAGYTEKALVDQELYQTIIEHRQKFNSIPGIDYNNHYPISINPIPITQVMDAWQADYKKMLEEMIYEENPPSFNEIISELTNLKERINALPWQFDKKTAGT